ncbi:hypothetical protein ARTHRO9AX_80194 [Arthrobacter sp. 9AX]|nr:hypothetical protein ARTHRO9AX_80194 [Arthrobacter sp. 9AX]
MDSRGTERSPAEVGRQPIDPVVPFLTAEWLLTVRNPNSAAVVCQECGATTRTNLLTGRIYSHQSPGGLEACRNSAMQIESPREGEKIEVAPLLYEAKPSVYGVVVSDGPASVKTISGGLPGKGRRR